MDTQKAKEEELRLQQQQDIEMIISQADSSLTTEQIKSYIKNTSVMSSKL